MDEIEKETYFKYYKGRQDGSGLTIITFDWIPRLDTWEHVCVSKRPEKGKRLNQLKFFVNGEQKGQGKIFF